MKSISISTLNVDFVLTYVKTVLSSFTIRSMETAPKTDIKPAASSLSGKSQYPVGYLYKHEMIDELMTGLLEALKLRGGKLQSVVLGDILDNCNLSPVTFAFYYSTVDSVIKELYKNIKEILTRINKTKEMYNEDAVINYLLGELSREETMLRILIIANDNSIWEENLKPIILYVAPEWKEFDDVTLRYVYRSFCSQFSSVLKLWGEKDFSTAYRMGFARVIGLWLEADTAIGKELIEIKDGNQ